MFSAYSILDPEEAKGMLSQLKGLEWEQGKARTEKLTGTIKQNLEVKVNDMSKAMAKYIGEKVLANKQVQKDWMPHKMSGIKFNKYAGGGTYNRHTDSPMMGEVRSDMACTIFLTDPDEYAGGELCMEVGGEVVQHKGKQGDCVVYACGQPHWVNPVTEGERVSGVTWIQSFIRDGKKRDILKCVQDLCFEIEDEMDGDDKYRKWFVDVGQIHGDLMRQWAE